MRSVEFARSRPYRGIEHVLHSPGCTVNGYATWGYRLECLVCGAVESAAVTSSVSAEDAPGRFAYDHRDCPAGPLELLERRRWAIRTLGARFAPLASVLPLSRPAAAGEAARIAYAGYRYV